MSNYSNTKATIAANVYTNHNNEVTAEMVKAGINAVVDTLIAGGFIYKGVATTSTNPGSPDANVFYIATAPGTYTNFGSLVVADGEVAILKYNGSWSKEVTGAATAAEVTALGHEVSDLGVIPDSPNDTLYVVDNYGNVVAKIDKDGIKTIGYSSKEFDTIDNGDNAFSICDNNGNVIIKLSGNSSVYDVVGKYIEKNRAKAQVCWIDDDFVVFDGGDLKPQYELVHDWCIDNDVRLDFAYIPDSYDPSFDTSPRLELAKEWGLENFHFLLHPIHDGWYTHSPDNVYDFEKVRSGIVNAIRFFDKVGFVGGNKTLVYPGSSNTYPDIVSLIKGYVNCGIIASDDGTNYGGYLDRYQIKRYALSLSASKPKSRIKQELAEYISRGDWIILYTHLYNYSAENILDETTASLANVLDIVDYVNGLQKIQPTEEIWNERKFMYDYFKK